MKLSSRFRLLLLELLCSFTILILCALVCVSFLAKTHQMSAESSDLTRAVYLAQSAAETWKAGGTPATQAEGYTVTITPVTPAVSGAENPGLRVCQITVEKGDQIIYTLKEVASYDESGT